MAIKTILIHLLLLLPCNVLFAQQDTTADKYKRMEVMIPMRDGVKLHTIIYSPKLSTEKLPFLITRTPYGVGSTRSPEKSDYTRELSSDGYFFVAQDIRG